MPIFSMTRRERVFHSAVNATSAVEAERAKRVADRRRRALAWRSRCPHASRASRQPISTAGHEGAANLGRASPMKPMKAPLAFSSAA